MQSLSSFLHDSTPQEWLAQPGTTARPLLLSDYQALGQRFGLKYCGTAGVGSTLIIDAIPSTVFTLSAVYLPLDAEDHSPADPLSAPCTTTSYFRLHMAWQNRVPTLAKMRQVLDRIAVAHCPSSEEFQQVGRKAAQD